MNVDRYIVSPHLSRCSVTTLEDFVYSSALCLQVVEIASFTEHLLGECESRSRFSQCPRCSEAVATEELTRHVQGPACNREFSVSLFNAIVNDVNHAICLRCIFFLLLFFFDFIGW